MTISDVVLWLFIINLGTAFGAGLYEARIVVPLWASSPPDSLRSPDSDRRFWAFVTTIPLTVLTGASLVVAWQAREPSRSWWLAAATAILIERIGTFAYFIPTMVRLRHTTGRSESVIKVTISRWARLNYLRLAMTFAAWLAALRALLP